MAKISTYGIDASPTVNDKVIGTKVEDNNNTYNYTIGDILDLGQQVGAFVPYINAIDDVNLGTYTLQADSIIVNTIQPISTTLATEYLGNQKGLYIDYDFLGLGDEVFALGDLFSLSNSNAIVVANTQNTIVSTHEGNALGFLADFSNEYYAVGDFAQLTNGTFIAVSNGATQQINTLHQGVNKGLLLNFSADECLLGDPNNDSIIVDNQYEVIYTQHGGNLIGLELYFPNGEYILGDINNIVNGTYLKVDDTNERVEISKALYTSGSEGTVGQILVSQGAVSAPQWQTITAASPQYGSFYDTTTQTCVLGDIAIMKYNTTVLSQGISIQNDLGGKPTQILFAEAGVYNIQFSAQLDRTTGGNDALVNIWLRKEGADIPYTATNITMKANAKNVVAAWNFFESFAAGEYAEIAWSQNDSVNIIQYPINLGIPYPAVPSVILTVNRIA